MFCLKTSSSSALYLGSSALYCTVLYCSVMYHTVLYFTVLYCTVLYCSASVLYCTVPGVHHAAELGEVDEPVPGDLVGHVDDLLLHRVQPQHLHGRQQILLTRGTLIIELWTKFRET